MSLQPASTRANAVASTDVGENIALSISITSVHAVSVGAACLSIGVGALSTVGTVVDGVDVTSNISGRSSCRRARCSSSLCGKLGGESVGNVSVRAGDNDIEAISHLTEVVGIRRRHSSSPEDTLDVDSRGWVSAGKNRRVVLRVAFKVNVEAVATTHSSTLLCACRRIVRAHQGETGILVGRVGSSQGGERVDEANRNLSSGCLQGVPGVGSESSCSVRERDVADTKRLLDTSSITLDNSSSRGLSGLRGGGDGSSDICRRIKDSSGLGVAARRGLGRCQSGSSQGGSTLSSDIDDREDEDGGRDGHRDGVDIDGRGRLGTSNSGEGCDGSGEGGTHLVGL